MSRLAAAGGGHFGPASKMSQTRCSAAVDERKREAKVKLE